MMIMPRTVEEILAHAEALADRFESDDFDGEKVSPAEYALIVAARERASAEGHIAAAVAAARRDGASWSRIGKIIGTSGEAARQRYAAAGQNRYR
ncbi:hypothetical protein ABW16_15625 [Mycolicibacter heraklionensis]|uniref:Uncharacterized protein n=2 Tax=Mycolicibacter heraklionensis TaxID=512402 RepID=A0ABR5FDE7_9MYCO|nr:hypothetical protein ABW16_15625 [Mycolicibacter heraklionensis]